MDDREKYIKIALFENKTLKYILICSLIAAVSFPLMNSFWAFPMFTNLVIKNTEQEAIRVAEYLKRVVVGENNNLTDISIAEEDVEEIIDEFSLMKLKIFSITGKTIFSTTAKDIGVVNTKDYFVNVVAKGNVFTKMVKKDTESLEGQKVTVDVVETYIPIMVDNSFMGAFEVYYDITEKTSALEKLFSIATFIPAVSMGIFLVIIIICLHKTNNNIIERKEMEVGLKIANCELKKEIAERNEAEKYL